MKKRLLSLVLSVLLLTSVFPFNAFATDSQGEVEVNSDSTIVNEEQTQNDILWEYEVCDGGISLTKYLGAQTDVFVPNSLEVNGEKLSVVKLDNSIFENNDTINSVTLASGIFEIGDRAFYDCDNLVCILLSEELTTIGAKAFYSCDAFNSVILYDSITNIGENAFAECPKLTVWCNEGTSGFIYAVNNNLPYEILNPDVAPETAELNGINYYILNGEAIAIGVTNTRIEEAIIPSTIEGYPVVALKGTFSDCGWLKSVSLPSSLKTIDSNTFYSCSSLTDISIPNGVTRIGPHAFSFCSSLKNIKIPSSVESIGTRAFYSCYGLKRVEMSDGSLSIGNYVFYNCTSLTSIEIPNGVEAIYAYTFDGCSNLTSVKFPNSLKSLDIYAFDDCTNLKTVIVPSSVTKLYANSFPASTILMVEENSYAHNFAVNNNLLYFVLHKMENPEIAYGAVIEGIVTNSDGSVADGATVEIYYEDGILKESVVADANGKYTFTYAEVGSYIIKAYNANGNNASTRVSVKRMNVFNVFVSGDTSITLKAGYNISGTVNVSNATVKLTDTNGNVINSVEVTNGTFIFADIANGTYVITAETNDGVDSKEITVYNGNVSDINLVINTNVASIYGYVEVADRKGKTERRNWVTISVYNESGVVIATCKSDKNGRYEISNLPLGDYSVVATVSEMRPDKKHGYDRLYDLYGYGYISITEIGSYELDAIILYEENNHLATVSGKANINKDKSKSCEFIMYNAFGVEHARVNSENGKYSFTNVKDGLYVIMALTENDGMGYTVITVLNGKVKGNTNINITKAEKIQKQEEKFENDIPELNDKQEAEAYRNRIAEEKRFYDGLSKKEKRQLSKHYVHRLSKYIEWLAACESVDGIENGGLVISGDEIENGNDISFTITVEKQEKWEDNKIGIETRKDFIHHNMKDKAGKSEIVEYYEISMTKTSDGNDKVITSVYKDTDAMGKFRVTLEIPEEYRGMKHYSLVHVHCGEVTVLTDLDDNPNTVTVEIDKFSTFALATTNEALYDEAESIVTLDDVITFKGYSVGPNGTSMCAGFDIDYEALELYEAKTGKTVDFGVVFTSYERLNGNNPLDSLTGEKITLENAAIIKTSLVNFNYATYELVLTDITSDLAEHCFTIAAYVYDGEKVGYIQGDGISESVTGSSLNQVKEAVQ